jgi:hypothetical protein
LRDAAKNRRQESSIGAAVFGRGRNLFSVRSRAADRPNHFWRVGASKEDLMSIRSQLRHGGRLKLEVELLENRFALNAKLQPMEPERGVPRGDQAAVHFAALDRHDRLPMSEASPRSSERDEHYPIGGEPVSGAQPGPIEVGRTLPLALAPDRTPLGREAPPPVNRPDAEFEWDRPSHEVNAPTELAPYSHRLANGPAPTTNDRDDRESFSIALAPAVRPAEPAESPAAQTPGGTEGSRSTIEEPPHSYEPVLFSSASASPKNEQAPDFNADRTRGPQAPLAPQSGAVGNVVDTPEPGGTATTFVVTAERPPVAAAETGAARTIRESTPGAPTEARSPRGERPAPAIVGASSPAISFEAGRAMESSRLIAASGVESSRLLFLRAEPRAELTTLAVAARSLLASDMRLADDIPRVRSRFETSIPAAPLENNSSDESAGVSDRQEAPASQRPTIVHLLVDSFALAPGLVERALDVFQTAEANLTKGGISGWYWLGFSSWVVAAALVGEALRRPRGNALSARLNVYGRFLVPEDHG